MKTLFSIARLPTFIFIILCFKINPACSNPTHPTATYDQKTGLVLAGGGARGLAHIGVIKALEEQGVRIDYISGTSMGALVGGLYASGLSIQEIETFATTVEWEQILNDNPNRLFLSFRRKQDQYDYHIPGELGMRNWSFLFPGGLLQGQQQYNLLAGMITKSPSQGQISDFSKLPIPFSAVATDIESGKAIILNQGNLAHALRASMSVPGVFSPVRINNHLLVDGGLTNNTPINVVREMGADIVIVSDVHTPLYRKEELGTFVKISNQILASLTTKNSLTQLKSLKANDIHIKPNVAGFTSSSFNLVQNIIDAGYQAGIAKSTALAKLPNASAPKSPNASAPLIIHDIQINNNTHLSHQMIRQHLHQRLNQPLNNDLLEQNLATLYGMGFFQLLTYAIEQQDNKNTLVINAEEPSWGPNFFKIKFNLASNFSDNNTFNLGLRHTYMPANSMGGEWRNEFQIGENRLFSSAYYQPLNDQHEYFLQPFIKFTDHVYKITDQDERNLYAEFRAEQQTVSTGLTLGYNISTNLNVSLNLYAENGDILVGPKSGAQLKRNYQDNVLALKIAYDTLNQVSFPEKGSRFQLDVLNNRDGLSPTDLGQEWQLETSQYFSINRHTFNAYVQYIEANNGKTDDVHAFNALGGFQRLSGFSDDSLLGNQLAFGRLKYQYRLSGNSGSSLNFPLYLGATLEAGNVYDKKAIDPQKRTFSFDNLLGAGSVYFGINSFLGPVYLAYGYHDTHNQSLYLYFGKEFN